MIYTSQPPSMAYGYASPASPWWPYAKYPDLHRGRVAGYCPSLGNTADRLWDFSGNGNHGTMMPTFATGPTWDVSDGRYANSFDGVNDYVSLPQANASTGNDYTVALWVNVGTFAALKGLLYIGGDATTKDQRIELAVSGGFRAVSYYSAGADTVSSATGFSTNTWIHLSAVRKSSDLTFKIFVNGIENASSSLTSATAAYGAGTQIRQIGRLGLATYNAHAIIDDIQIYNRALSQKEFTQLYQLGRGGSYAIDYELMMEEMIAAGGPFPHFIRRSQIQSGGLVAC